MNKYNSVKEALEDLQNGKIILVSDDEKRENEADMILSSQFATPENINLMAKYARGLICMPMSESIAQRLNFYPMVNQNTDNHNTAFTVSGDHKETSTGISAYDRSLTALKCIEKGSKPEDFRRPGHMFPLVAKKGGVLVRAGHTEATVDLCRLAGLKECGLCCEVMDEDGTMMKKEKLFNLAQKLSLKFITIKDLQDYIRINEKHVVQEAKAKLPTEFGEFTIYGYVNDITGEHHVALVKGEIKDGENILSLRMFNR